MAPVSTKEATSVGLRKAQLGIVINILLAATKGVAGVVGHSYALVADAIESASDIILKTYMDPLVYSPRSASPPFLRGALQQGLSSSNILMFEPATYKPLLPNGVVLY
jgi:hypothetical protein